MKPSLHHHHSFFVFIQTLGSSLHSHSRHAAVLTVVLLISSWASCVKLVECTFNVSSAVALVVSWKVKPKQNLTVALLSERTMAWPVGHQWTHSWPCVCPIGQTLIGLFWTAGHDTSHECCLWPNTNLHHVPFTALWTRNYMELKVIVPHTQKVYINYDFACHLVLHNTTFDVFHYTLLSYLLHAIRSKSIWQ